MRWSVRIQIVALFSHLTIIKAIVLFIKDNRTIRSSHFRNNTKTKHAMVILESLGVGALIYAAHKHHKSRQLKKKMRNAPPTTTTTVTRTEYYYAQSRPQQSVSPLPPSSG